MKNKQYNQAIQDCCRFLDSMANGENNPEIHMIGLVDQVQEIIWHKRDAWRQAQYLIYHNLRKE